MNILFISFLDVVDAQRSALEAKRAGGKQLVTIIKLIKALGGGWDEELGMGN